MSLSRKTFVGTNEARPYVNGNQVAEQTPARY